MQEEVYRNKNVLIFNFSKMYFNNVQQLASSLYFVDLLQSYVEQLQENHSDYYNFLVAKKDSREVASELAKLARMLLVFELHELDHYLLRDLELLDKIVEDIYNYWRKLQRFSLLYAGSSSDIQSSNFIESDTRFNTLVIGLYRSVQEKIRGSKNHVYRQLQAGTNASIVLRDYKINLPESYAKLKKIPFIDSIMLRTPLILFPKSNKREGTFDEIKINPVDSFIFESKEWMVFPAKVGTLLAFVYFHRDFLPSVAALSGLFELADDRDCLGKQPELILLFGNQDQREVCEFYEDKENDIVIGSVSYSDKIDYFGYLKKMMLTLHNIRMIARGYLPLHGAMIDITFKSGIKKGVVLIGDSGAGKSESIEALQVIASDKIAKLDVVFDDMGAMYISDDEVVCTGTEIGAFIRLDDLEKGSAYKDMDRSIFFNPHLHNARVVLPVNTFKAITEPHRIDMMLYANNYTDKIGVASFKNYEETKSSFIEGKRMSLGTTDETGITQTYFANPFGPAQRQKECDVLFDKFFKKLFENNVFVGEIYTHLGIKESKEKLLNAANILLEVMEK